MNLIATKMPTKHSSQMASLIGKMLGQKTEEQTRSFTIPDASGDISAQLSTTFNEARSVNRQNLLKVISNARIFSETGSSFERSRKWSIY